MAAYLAAQPDVVVAYHFGSTARGLARPDSDVDIAVLLEDGEADGNLLARQLKIIAALDEMDRRDVQVTLLNDATPFFIYQVIKEGRCFYERDRFERVEFQVGALKRYFDFKPILDFQNRAFIQRVKEKGLAGD
jgi:predicted nucleotidyltransferase